ncbi:rna polymerase ii transcription initiation nucleotide excision repair factor tfiih [Fusarium albosuccineum]|uniref:Rna polymerase ii transcription initiation nucleotide excision repair factor tfiih n=1 Tax=Fusarium albosuccineum TaxID=1237068 RepID=A0A8H4K8B0_9HYPO|nr:rna polymerase ii transcription initiation nucleotide excision repair factor tfiih [Fusarium albosuccineum]
MLPEDPRFLLQLGLLLPLSFLTSAQPEPALSLVLEARDNNDEPIPGGPVNDLSYLPAQIGGIVGAYAVSLVLVAIALIALSKKRREHLSAGIDEVDFAVRKDITSPDFPPPHTTSLNIITQSPIIRPNYQDSTSPDSPNPYIHPSPSSTVGAPGVNPFVDQRIVAADKVMAQTQLEDMYKHVLEHEDAKKRGLVYEVPLPPGVTHQPRSSASGMSLRSAASSPPKKERNKPATLNLNREEKTQSRASSLLSALRSPKKKAMKGMSISSPIMTPQSGEFPRHESQEMSSIPPRHYAPAAPPPVPTDQVPYSAPLASPRSHGALPTPPDISPESVQSIDERIGSQLPPVGHARTVSHAHSEYDPESAISEHSQAPLVGLPSSPKPGARFPSLPSLPASPKPGATFQRNNAPSAVRTGGALPLRAYEPALASPNTIARTTKQTVFERKGPLSPSGAMTPLTAGAVPYSPYQPFTPCMPVTPSLVTKEDRKRMKRMVPKTPTMEMVRSSDDIW